MFLIIAAEDMEGQNTLGKIACSALFFSPPCYGPTAFLSSVRKCCISFELLAT